MDSSTIELQLWIIIGLFSLVLLGQVFCVFFKSSKKKEHENFSEMWDQGKYDELILESGIALRDNPNLTNALFFGGKALHAKGKYEQAKEYIEQLMISEPTLRATLEELLELIVQDMAANKSLKSGTREELRAP